LSTGGIGRGRYGQLPAGFRPPSEGHGNPAASDAPADRSPTPSVPAAQAASEQLQVGENPKAAIEALHRLLKVEEQNNKSLALAQDKLVGDFETLRKVDSYEKERRVAKSRRQSGNTIKSAKKKGKVTRGKSARKDDQADAVLSSSSNDSASGSNLTSSEDDNSNATGKSSSDYGHGPPGPPLPPSGSSPSNSQSESDGTTRKRSTVPTTRRERVEKEDRTKVVRRAKSHFKTLFNHRIYALLRR